MASIPESLKNLLHNFMHLFSSDEFKEEDYMYKLLDAAQNDEERKDLQDLFASTTDYYAERKAISESDLTPSEYLFNLYMASWKRDNPEASVAEIQEAEKEYEKIISQGVFVELENLEQDSQDVESLLEKLNNYSESPDTVDNQEEFK